MEPVQSTFHYLQCDFAEKPKMNQDLYLTLLLQKNALNNKATEMSEQQKKICKRRKRSNETEARAGDLDLVFSSKYSEVVKS